MKKPKHIIAELVEASNEKPYPLGDDFSHFAETVVEFVEKCRKNPPDDVQVFQAKGFSHAPDFSVPMTVITSERQYMTHLLERAGLRDGAGGLENKTIQDTNAIVIIPRKPGDKHPIVVGLYGGGYDKDDNCVDTRASVGWSFDTEKNTFTFRQDSVPSLVNFAIRSRLIDIDAYQAAQAKTAKKSQLKADPQSVSGEKKVKTKKSASPDRS